MSPIVHVTGRTGLSQIRVWLGFLPPSDRCAAVLRVELQRGAIVGHAEAIRTQSRKPSKAHTHKKRQPTNAGQPHSTRRKEATPQCVWLSSRSPLVKNHRLHTIASLCNTPPAYCSCFTLKQVVMGYDTCAPAKLLRPALMWCFVCLSRSSGPCMGSFPTMSLCGSKGAD